MSIDKIEQDLWYDLPSLPEPVSGGQLLALIEMVNSDGWRVYTKHKNAEARSSACIALNPTSPPEQCQAHRAIWYAKAGEVAYANMLKLEAENVEGVTKDELNFNIIDVDDLPVPTRGEYDLTKTDKP